MKKILTLTAIAATTLSALAQSSTPTSADYAHFAETKTLAVLDANIFSDYNVALKRDMATDWTPTTVEYISEKQFESKRQDPQYSFFLTTTVTYPDDKVKTKYTYLSLLIGKANTKVTSMPDLISIPLAYYNNDDQEDYCYKMAAFIRFMLAHVEKMKADPSLISDTPLLMYNKNKGSLANKTLYLLEEELDSDINTAAAIKKVYPYKVKLVTKDEIRQAIEDKDENVVFLHKVGPGKLNTKARCYKMLMGAADSQVYYFGYHNISSRKPDCLLKDDLKEIAKQ